MVTYIILWVFSIIGICYFLFLYLFHLKLIQLGKNIDVQFHKKSQIIPALYEISQHHIVKPDEIFSEILRLRLTLFSQKKFLENFYDTIELQQKIHKELDFIFRVCSKHPKLMKDYKFYYIKEVIFSLSKELWENVKLYKHMAKKYNQFRFFKIFTIIWILIPIQKKEEM